MKNTSLVLSTTLVLALSGCSCLKSIEIEPQLNSVDIKIATIDSINAKLKFELKECCPTKRQKEIIYFLEAQTRNLYVQLINNQITLTDYNAKIAAARNAIENVVLHCTKIAPPIPTSINNTGKYIISKSMQKMTPDEAWNNLDTVTQGL